MLVTNIFSFSHNVFYPSQNKFQFFMSLLFCHLQMLSTWISLIFVSLGKELICRKLTNSIKFQPKSDHANGEGWPRSILFAGALNHPLTLSHTTNFGRFQTGRVCRQQFQIWWKWQKVPQLGRKNTVGKGEIARYEQFLLFPQCFQKTCIADT